MAIQRVTVLEFAPTADEIWCLPRHERDGYARYDAEDGLLSFMDTERHAKPRPEIVTTYAGGKATNVARVLDRLLTGEDRLQVDLVTFLPPPPEGPLRELELGKIRGTALRPSTAAGIYVQCLQIEGLTRVRPRFEIVDELKESGEMQTTRRCIEITLKEGSGSVNFSPRIVWSQEAAEAVLARVAEVAHGADLVVMAGAPPVWEVSPDSDFTRNSFYARIMGTLQPDCQVSIDARGQYLSECLLAQKAPRFVLMNTEEFDDLSEFWHELRDRSFPGTLLIHNERGCWVWDGKLPEGEEPFSEAEYFPSMSVSKVYSTIGAGDAMHAGFLKEWVDKEYLDRAVVYSQIVAAVSISNEKATHGVDARIVEDRFSQVWPEGESE
ncbi:PfkB family carbohydrate kinase [Candidatus Poribacteria bacterium]